ncbi:spore gernimation protein GerPD [Bacillus sp. FJAT-27231]|uniref:spore gernimation protein GerPD n=1 Tax=Bacillus sp. FJAT-27231 TaxID=1679168 RepID=UPI000671394A|nr:spore gernimation protein GerPD [Bacillus sp. FJAT-27231]KMY55493.1 spore gernimation protein GerPD [Bacillus sp. FJAT-27231]
MNFTVVNKNICVDNLAIEAVASSSIVLVGDTDAITLSSMFDTPPESFIVGPLVPLSSE